MAVLLANKLGVNLVNLGKCGASNDYILDKMIENYDNIKENDLVILGKTVHSRFDVKNPKTNEFFNVLGEYPTYPKHTQIYTENHIKDQNFTNDEYETIINFIYHFASDELFKKRQNLRFDFIKDRLLKDKKISYYNEWSTRDVFTLNIERIYSHTKGKIEDSHFSFNGHKQMFEHFYYLMIKPDKLI